MSKSDTSSQDNWNRRQALSVGGALIVLGAAGLAFYFRQRPPRGPRLLNESTKAREVRPLDKTPDERFAPLPIEREKHDD